MRPTGSTPSSGVRRRTATTGPTATTCPSSSCTASACRLAASARGSSTTSSSADSIAASTRRSRISPACAFPRTSSSNATGASSSSSPSIGVPGTQAYRASAAGTAATPTSVPNVARLLSERGALPWAPSVVVLVFLSSCVTHRFPRHSWAVSRRTKLLDRWLNAVDAARIQDRPSMASVCPGTCSAGDLRDTAACDGASSDAACPRINKDWFWA